MQKRIGNYTLLKEIGSGAFGQVYKAKYMKEPELYAIKKIDKKKIAPPISSYLEREVSILREINNTHVVKLHDVKASVNNYYLIFEYCNAGDLSLYVKKQGGRLTEAVARKIIRQVVDGLSSVYALGAIHRDIKLSNILVHQESELIIKISDFGFARKLDSEAPLKMSTVGTLINMSPEMLDELAYTVKSDIWGLGTIAYEMLCGKPPFKANDKKNLKKIVELGEYMISKKLRLSTEAIDFISCCLQYYPFTRIHWRDLASHPFIATDRITKFDFIVMKKKNGAGLSEDEKNYKLSSKVKYKFFNLCAPIETKDNDEEWKSEQDFESRDSPKSEEDIKNEKALIQRIFVQYIKY